MARPLIIRSYATAACALVIAACGGGGGFKRQIDRAQAARRPVLIEFRADWCGPCHFFEREVLANDQVQDALRQIEFVRIDVDTREGNRAQRHYQVKAVPTFVVLDQNGAVVERLIGIADVATPQAFIDFLSRIRGEAAARITPERKMAVARAIDRQAALVRGSPGSLDAGLALARVLLSDTVDEGTEAELFAIHALAAERVEPLVLAVYTALADNEVTAALVAAQRALEIAPQDRAALTAAAHSELERNRLDRVFDLHHRCERAHPRPGQERLCETIADRWLLGRPAPAIALIRRAVILYFIGLLHPAMANEVARRDAETRAIVAAWTHVKEPASAQARAAGVNRENRDSPWRLDPATVGLVALRFDRGLADRVMAGGRYAGPIAGGDRGFVPGALLHGEVGADSDGRAAYEGFVEAGVATGGNGASVGIYTGLGVSDPGAAAAPTMAVPFELALSYAGRRFGIEGFARTSLVRWSNEDRRRGSEHTPDGMDELALGLAARVPAPIIGRALIGVRYDELLDDSIVGLWIGTDLVRRQAPR